MGQVSSKPALRPFLPADVPVLAAIFEASVLELTEEDYSASQQAAWAASVDDDAAFAARLAKQLTLIATIAGAPVGFASLAGNDRVDMLYVHPHAARQGVATALIDALEKLAAARGAAVLNVDASDSARAFFQKRGYEGLRRNTVPVGDEWLGNTSMRKTLTPLPAARTVQ